MVLPAQLFSLEVHCHSTINCEIRDFLNTNGVSLPPHSSRLIINQLAYGLYDDARDKDAAIELAEGLISRGCRRRPHAIEETTKKYFATIPSKTRRTIRKIAHNGAMRLKDNENKFSGELVEC